MGMRILRQTFMAGCLSLTAAGGASRAAADECQPGSYRAGAAQADITGPIVGVGMMGYADLGQFDQGLHMRLRARALVVSDPCTDKTVALVIDDLAMIFGGVKKAVVERLATELPGVFDHDNLLLSATHTHAGPGGFANYVLYNITTLGFSPKNFEAIVAGTTSAVVKAYRQRQKARLLINHGELTGLQFNRSPEAYDNNPESERARYGGNVDTGMTLLGVVAEDSSPLAAFNWYPVHGVSLPMQNKLVSGDNKGMAAYLLERHMGVTYRKEQEFVAGFVQANAGDVSPYPLGRPEEESSDGFARNRASGEQQYAKALELLQGASVALQGPVAYAHRFEDLAYRKLQSGHETCNAVLGNAFAAGTENGRPVGIFQEGSIYGLNWPRITTMPQEQACHAEKVMLLPTGFAKPSPWTAQVAPFQLVRLGELAIIAAPFEITTMAGRRLKESVLAALAPSGVRYVVLSGLSNEYLHYVTTREEYAKQAYEGGSTLFGPWSLEAYTEIFQGLAQEIEDGIAQPDGAVPPVSEAKGIVHEPRPAFDTLPIGKSFGDVAVAPQSEYRQGDAVQVTFHGGHPVHGAPEGGSFLTVEQWQDGVWSPRLYDWDPETQLRWERAGLNGSKIHIRWETDDRTPFGVYRICHAGRRKPLFGSEVKPYVGCSEGFQVVPAE